MSAAALLLMAAVGLALVLILTREAQTHTNIYVHTHTIQQTINLSIKTINQSSKRTGDGEDDREEVCSSVLQS